MIYLRDSKLLFIKPKKVAGTSIEIALSCFATPDDIVTPLGFEEERTRAEKGGQFPVNWGKSKRDDDECRAVFQRFLATGEKPKRWFGLRRPRLYPKHRAKFFNHITPDEISRGDGRALLGDAFMVTICRHPYEQVVSFASHIGTVHSSFEQALPRAIRKSDENEVYLFGERRPDFVIRYENLQEDLTLLGERLGMNIVEKMPFTLHRNRKDRRQAADILTPSQKATIQEKCRKTFEAFDYQR